MANKLEHEASLLKGLDQYSFNKFAKAFEVFPRILSENAGLNANEIITKLYSANNSTPTGIDIEVKMCLLLKINAFFLFSEWNY